MITLSLGLGLVLWRLVMLETSPVSLYGCPALLECSLLETKTLQKQRSGWSSWPGSYPFSVPLHILPLSEHWFPITASEQRPQNWYPLELDSGVLPETQRLGLSGEEVVEGAVLIREVNSVSLRSLCSQLPEVSSCVAGSVFS